MSKQVEVKVTSDTISKDGRRVNFEYTDPITLTHTIRSLLNSSKMTEDEIVAAIEKMVINDIAVSKTIIDNTPLTQRKIMVTV